MTQVTIMDGDMLLPEDHLPPNLRELWLQSHQRVYLMMTSHAMLSRAHSLQPLLALSRLERLFLEVPGAVAAAREVAQLSSISSLKELHIDVFQVRGCALDSSIATWGVLPLRSLKINPNVVASAGFVQQLTVFQGLTRLFFICRDDMKLAPAMISQDMLCSVATPELLATVLNHMPHLQLLTTDMSVGQDMQLAGKPPCIGESRNLESVVALLQAIGGSECLNCVQLWLPVSLDDAAVEQLTDMLGQLLPCSLVTCCAVRTNLVVLLPSMIDE